MSDALRVPGASRPFAGILAGLGVVLLLLGVLYKVYDLRALDDNVTALAAVGLLAAAILLELALHFFDRRDWLRVEGDHLEMPRYWRGPLPLSNIANVEVVPAEGRRRALLRLQLRDAMVINYARPVLCPRRLHRRTAAIVFTRPDLFTDDPTILERELKHRITSARSTTDGAEILLSQRPQDAQGSLAGVAVVFGLAFILTALVHSL
jgi:hypothetical protein